MPASAQLLILLAVLVMLWLVMMRPARRQQRSMQRLQQEIEVGDEVVISAGIFGTIRAVEGLKVDLEIAPGVVISVARQVVVRRASETDQDEERAEDETPLDEQFTPSDGPDRSGPAVKEESE